MKKLSLIVVLFAIMFLWSCGNKRAKISNHCDAFIKTGADHKGRLIKYSSYTLLKSTEPFDEKLIIQSINTKPNNKLIISFLTISNDIISSITITYTDGKKELLDIIIMENGINFYEINSKSNLLIKEIKEIQLEKSNGKYVNFQFLMLENVFFKNSLNCLYDK